MIQLTKKEIITFQKRFDCFKNARVSHVFYSCRNELFRIILEVQDLTESSQPCCKFITLIMWGCFSMKIINSNAENYVLSYGLHILFEKNNVGLEFGCFNNPPKNITEMITSPLHAVGKSLYWMNAVYK